MNPTVFLHIGTNKTGSTAIQEFFHANRDILKSRGVLYPSFGSNETAHYQFAKVLGFHDNRSLLDSVDRIECQKLLGILQDELMQSDIQSIVISSETFSLPSDIGKIKELFINFDIKVIVYLRRHDTWWESAYNQAVKMVRYPPWGRGVEAYVDYHRQFPRYAKWLSLLDRWSAVFGRENMIVRPYELQQNQPNLIEDFFNALEMRDKLDGLDTSVKYSNRSLDNESVDLLDVVQRVQADDETYKKLLNFAIKLSQGGKHESMLSPAFRRRLIEENAAEYALIAREYLGREDGVLFFDPLPKLDDVWHPYQPLGPIRAANWIIKAWSDDVVGEAIATSKKKKGFINKLSKGLGID